MKTWQNQHVLHVKTYENQQISKQNCKHNFLTKIKKFVSQMMEKTLFSL